MTIAGICCVVAILLVFVLITIWSIHEIDLGWKSYYDEKLRTRTFHEVENNPPSLFDVI